MSVADYRTDADLNTTISGINIAEGCPPGNVNDAIRQLMADLRGEQIAVDEKIEGVGAELDVKASANTFGRCKVDGTTITAVDGVISVIKTGVLQMMFPVGSLYMTTDTADPAIIFGFGTWQKIEGRMILGAGSGYTVGSTGGSATHTLSWNEMPQHTHTRGTMDITGTFGNCEERSHTWSGAFYPMHTGTGAGKDSDGGINYDFRASRSWTGETSVSGGGAAHNNMPPYFVANIWRRTA